MTMPNDDLNAYKKFVWFDDSWKSFWQSLNFRHSRVVFLLPMLNNNSNPKRPWTNSLRIFFRTESRNKPIFHESSCQTYLRLFQFLQSVKWTNVWLSVQTHYPFVECCHNFHEPVSHCKFYLLKYQMSKLISSTQFLHFTTTWKIK